MLQQKTPKRFFWTVLLTCFLLSGVKLSATFASTTPSNLIISEFMADNGSGLTDEDGDYSDWIEIYNQGDTPVNLGGWALTDDLSQPQKWPFPDMTLGGHEYLVVFASGKNRTTVEPGAYLHTNFKLSKSGEFLALHNVLEGRFMDSLLPRYPEQFRDVSYGRFGQDLVFGFLSTPTPGAANNETFTAAGAVAEVSFSVTRGFFNAPVTVTLETDTPGATIRYTTDGSEPTETAAAVYTAPISINQTTVLRAAAFKPNHLPSPISTQTYLFPNDILARFIRGDSQISVVQRVAQYLTATPAAKIPLPAGGQDALEEGLTSIPSVSLVMDNQSLTGLYANPNRQGRSSERPVSFELIYPTTDRPNAQVNAGIRMYGHNANPAAKPAFRLFFRSSYGAGRFKFPLFPNSPVETFDTLVLQPVNRDALARNEWLRASQLEMSGFGAHGLFVNLYLNGQYAGVYNLVERPDADFMSSYLGDPPEMWFVANQAGPLDDDNPDPAAAELNLLFTSLALAPPPDNSLSQPEYLSDVYAAAAAYLDPAQLADYMLLSWYAGLLEWPEPVWYAGIHQNDLPGRGKLLIGDEQAGPPDGIHQAYFDVLMQNPDFQVAFADRLYQHLFNNGALVDANAQARWQRLAGAIEPAFLTESTLAAYTGNRPSFARSQWEAAQQDVLAQMDGAAVRLVGRARQAGYYPPFDPPVFNHQGELVEAGVTLQMSLPRGRCENCTIYYTTDGSDPRLPVTGKVIPTAAAYTGPLVLTTSTQVKARIWDGQNWSALRQADFSVVEQDSKLRITEIMYNPAGGDDYEFIELKNTGRNPVELAGLSLDEGVRFTFPPAAPPLEPGGFAVLVSNPAAFAERYPAVAIAGVYEGHLSNKGEKLILKNDAGQTLIELTYGDEQGWPISPDGRGDSLTLVDESGNPGDPRNWRASARLYGSPGAAEP